MYFALSCVCVCVCACVCVFVSANSLVYIHICSIRYSHCGLYYMFFLCRQAGTVIEGSTAVKISDIMKLFKLFLFPPIQLLDTFPLLLLRQRNEAVLVNFEELIINADSFVTLLTLDSSCNEQQSSTTVRKPHMSINSSLKCGRPTHVSKFPRIVEYTTDIMGFQHTIVVMKTWELLV